MPKDKQGNKLTWKEYIARWKQGIQNISPLQQIRVQIRSTWITLVGIVGGIIICLFSIATLWWLLLILIGALGNTIVQQIGLFQRKKIFDSFTTENPIEISVDKGGWKIGQTRTT